MRFIAQSECCALLGIDPKTLRFWLKQANLSFVAHPADARLKCLSLSHLEHLATAHGRTLSWLLEGDAALSQARAVPLSLEPFPSEFAGELASLRESITHLHTTVMTLQQQVTQLTLELLKEHTPRSQQRLPSLQGHPASPAEALSVLLRTSPEPEQKKKTQDPRPRASRKGLPIQLLPLIEYGANGSYVLLCPTRGELALRPDSPSWFEWLATLSSFRFVGQHGRLSSYRNSGRSSWMAYRRIHTRRYEQSLGHTQQLTIAHLEHIAATFQSYSAC